MIPNGADRVGCHLEGTQYIEAFRHEMPVNAEQMRTMHGMLEGCDNDLQMPWGSFGCPFWGLAAG